MKKINFDEYISKSWITIFTQIDEKIYRETEKLLNEEINKNRKIFPKYEEIFSFTNYCLFDDVKVIIIGQDCYHGFYYKDNIIKSQATGLAFSVPKDCIIPPSLNNIYNNMIKYKQIYKKPEHGNLEYLAYQGVLLLNTSLTVERSKPNSHQYIWSKFTDEFIKILSKMKDNLIFVLLGSNSLDKLCLIQNQDKHKFIISSHPSPLSAYNKLRNYECFMKSNIFGQINRYLQEYNKDIIDWQIL